ncbi:MAG: tetratricopeptide repeat protein [Myxococcaceae bacterium]|nr:tetratricopeptide repeat protein [Myxococcaceae bacterium]
MNEEEDRVVEAADRLEDIGDLDGAIEVFVSFLNTVSVPRLHALLGRLYYLKQEYCRAIEQFSTALAVKPDAATTLFFRGQALAMSGKLETAIQDFNAVLRLQPAAADAYREIGYIREFQKRLAEAREAYEKARTLDPAMSDELDERITDLDARLREGG